MGSILEDVRTGAEWVAEALRSSGYRADFTLDSLREIDRFFEEQSGGGRPRPGGLLAEETGKRIFALGAYVGETIRRTRGEGEWKRDDTDPEAELNVTLQLPGGLVVWPVQRVGKRLVNGGEDGILAYGLATLLSSGFRPPGLVGGGEPGSGPGNGSSPDAAAAASVEAVSATLERPRPQLPDEEPIPPGEFSWHAMLLAALGLCAAAAAGIAVQASRKGTWFDASDPGPWAPLAAIALAIATGYAAAVAARRVGVPEISAGAFVPLGALFAAMTFSERVAYWVVPSRTGGFAWSPYAGWTQNLGVAAGVAGALMLAAWLGGAIGHTLGWPPDATLPFEGAVAQRHLSLSRRTLFPRRGHKRPPTVVMTMMSVAGITVGTWAMIVVLSVMSGFELDLKKKILGINAHGIVLKHTTSFTEWKELLPKVAEVPGVAGATPFIHAEGMVVTRSNPTGAIIRGIDPATVGRVSDLPASVESGDLMHLADPAKIAVPARLEPADTTPTPGAEKPPLLPGVALGREMARTLKVWVGDPVTIVNPIGELGPTGPVPRSRQFRVAAIFYSGMYEYDAKIAFIGLREAQTFFGLGEAVSGIEVKTGEMDEAPAIMKRVRNALQGFPYGVKDWGEMNRNLFSALRLEKIVMGIILAFIVLVATFTIVATLLMMVVQKSREVAILKSMGARDASVMKIFVLEGLILGALGAALGTALGLSSCVVIQVLGINLDPEVYYISSLPVQIVPVQIAVVAVTAFILSFMATVYPAISASRLPPVEAFKE